MTGSSPVPNSVVRGTSITEPPASPVLRASTAIERSDVDDAEETNVGVGSRNASKPGADGSVTVDTTCPALLERTVSNPT